MYQELFRLIDLLECWYVIKVNLLIVELTNLDELTHYSTKMSLKWANFF